MPSLGSVVYSCLLLLSGISSEETPRFCFCFCFFHSPVTGRLDNFQSLFIMIKEAMSFWGHMQSFSQGTHLGAEWLVHTAGVCSLQWKPTIKRVSTVAVLYLRQLLTSVLVPGQAAGRCTWQPDHSNLEGAV